MSILKRFKNVRMVYEEIAWFASNGQGLRYNAYLIREHVAPEMGVKPNELGCLLWALWWDIELRLQSVAYILFGVFSQKFEEEKFNA